MSKKPDSIETRETPEESRRWKRVYITVIIYTALLITGLWGFSQLYK
jgi:hypothetical protein